MKKQKIKKPFYKRWWFIAIVVIVVGSALLGGDDDEASKETKNPAEEVSKDVGEQNQDKDTEKQEEVEPEPEPEPIPEPDPIPEPIIYEGSGDDVIDIEKTEEGPIILYIQGNQDERHFSIKGFTSDDRSTELFVNTTGAYEGITLDPSGETTLLEITSNGPWKIESRSMRTMRIIESPGTIEGTGDEVILVEGEKNKANIKGNNSERHFSVKGYDPSSDLLVNTTDKYEGVVRVNSDTFLLEITAVGEWSIELE